MRRGDGRARRFATVAVLLALGLVVAGGGASWRQGPGLARGVAQAGAARGTRVNLAVPHRVLFTVALPVYVAQEKGLYEAEGLVVQPVFTRGGGETVQNVIAGDADIALETGPSAVMGAFVRGAPVRIVSASITGLDVFWFVRADSPLRRLEDLAGRRVGYSSPGSSTHQGVLAMAALLKARGLAEPVAEPVGSPPDQYAAVSTGQIDAGWSTPPILLSELRQGRIRILVRGTDLTQYRDVAIRVNFANSRFLEQRPDAVAGFLRAQKRAWDFIFENREEAMEIYRRRAQLADDVPILLGTYDFYTRDMFRLAPVSGLEQIVQEAVQFGFLERPLSSEQLGRLVDLRFVPPE